MMRTFVSYLYREFSSYENKNALREDKLRSVETKFAFIQDNFLVSRQIGSIDICDVNKGLPKAAFVSGQE